MDNKGPEINFNSIKTSGVIARGGFGIVFKSKVDATNEVIAVKRIDLHGDDGVYDDKKFFNECGILKSLNHKNIVRFITSHKTSNYGYIGMEYIRSDLQCHINVAGLLPMDEIKLIAKDVLQGLAFCHANKVIHRDLKPCNILITDAGVSKLADFGLARDMGARPNSPMTMDVMTSSYRPPELLLEQGTYTYSADIWSFVCTFCELVSGNVLFEAYGDTQLLNAMFELLGTPSEADFPNLNDTRIGQNLIAMGPTTDLIAEIPRFGLYPAAETMVKEILRYDPNSRPTADELLLNPFFG